MVIGYNEFVWRGWWLEMVVLWWIYAFHGCWDILIDFRRVLVVIALFIVCDNWLHWVILEGFWCLDMVILLLAMSG